MSAANTKFWSRFILFKADFGNIHPYVQCKLFKQYIWGCYGAPLWLLSSSGVSDAWLAWGKALRKIWKLSPMTHYNVVALVAECKLMLPLVWWLSSLRCWQQFLGNLCVIHISLGHISAQVRVLGVSCHIFICTFHFNLHIGWPACLWRALTISYVFIQSSDCKSYINKDKHLEVSLKTMLLQI